MLETVERSREDAFADRMLETLNRGAVALMLSVGHRTGLFDTMAGLPPSDSRRIAEAAGLQERYVREWLGTMVTGRVVEHDPAAGTYRLPAEHAACLTRAAGTGNVAQVAQFLPILAAVEDPILDRFRNGGGVPYTEFHRFHEAMEEESAGTVVANLVDGILPLVPGLVPALERGIRVLDVGCGRGRALHAMAKAFPRSRFEGCDFFEDAVAYARRGAPPNLTFTVRDAARLDDRDEFDLVTAFDAIHDQADPARVLRNILAALKPGGVFLMQDIKASSHLHENLDHPLGPFLYTISCMHCMTVSLACGGAGLGTCWGEQTAVRMLAEAGFVGTQVRQLEHDFMNNYYLSRKA